MDRALCEPHINEDAAQLDYTPTVDLLVTMSYLPELSKDGHTDIDEAKAKALTRRVLWKLDLHILPVLTLVRHRL